MTPANITLRHVGKQFGSTVAVDDLNLDVQAGEFVSLLGPSGCGKTTTLRMIAGLEQPSRGEILSRNTKINDIPVHRRNFGMVFQDHALFPHKTAFENIAFGLKYRRVERSEIATSGSPCPRYRPAAKYRIPPAAAAVGRPAAACRVGPRRGDRA